MKSYRPVCVMQSNNYIFTTEGHPIPVRHPKLQKSAVTHLSLLESLEPKHHQDRDLAEYNYVDEDNPVEILGVTEEDAEVGVAISRQAYSGSAPVRRVRSAEMASGHSKSALQPSALDRRICPELQVVSLISTLLLLTQ